MTEPDFCRMKTHDGKPNRMTSNLVPAGLTPKDPRQRTSSDDAPPPEIGQKLPVSGIS